MNTTETAIMDELYVFGEQSSHHSIPSRRRGRPPKRQATPGPVFQMSATKRAKQSVSSPEDIDGTSDPMNYSIARSVKRRQTNAQRFYDSVVNQMGRKYKNLDEKEEPIIDLNDMQIISNSGRLEERDSLDFGYFADNTLEALRQKFDLPKPVFRNTFNRSKPKTSKVVIPFTPKTFKPVVSSTPNTSKAIKPGMASDKRFSKTVPQKPNSYTRGADREKSKQSIATNTSKQTVTNIVIAEEESNDGNGVNGSEELDINQPSMICENMNVLSDIEDPMDNTSTNSSAHEEGEDNNDMNGNYESETDSEWEADTEEDDDEEEDGVSVQTIVPTSEQTVRAGTRRPRGRGKGEQKSRVNAFSDSIDGAVEGMAPKFGCSHCGKSFKQKINLKRHLLIHSGVKPHHCNRCERRFNQSTHLRKHMIRIHAKQYTHNCPKCGKGYHNESPLRIHLAVSHGNN